MKFCEKILLKNVLRSLRNTSHKFSKLFGRNLVQSLKKGEIFWTILGKFWKLLIKILEENCERSWNQILKKVWKVLNFRKILKNFEELCMPEWNKKILDYFRTINFKKLSSNVTKILMNFLRCSEIILVEIFQIFQDEILWKSSGNVGIISEIG